MYLSFEHRSLSSQQLDGRDTGHHLDEQSIVDIQQYPAVSALSSFVRMEFPHNGLHSKANVARNNLSTSIFK